MVKVTGPLHSVEARGRLGDLEYNTWRGISVVRAHKDPSPPTSTHQLAQQDLFKLVCREWKNLTDDQRSSWTAYANTHLRTDWTGKPIRMSGFNAFVSLNQWYRYYNEAYLYTAPGPPNIPGLIALYKVTHMDGSYLNWTVSGTTPVGAFSFLLRVAGPYTPGTQPDFHHAVYSFHTDALDFTFLIPPASVPTYSYYGFYARLMKNTTGQAGPWTLLHTFTEEYV